MVLMTNRIRSTIQNPNALGIWAPLYSNGGPNSGPFNDLRNVHDLNSAWALNLDPTLQWTVEHWTPEKRKHPKGQSSVRYSNCYLVTWFVRPSKFRSSIPMPLEYQTQRSVFQNQTNFFNYFRTFWPSGAGTIISFRNSPKSSASSTKQSNWHFHS